MITLTPNPTQYSLNYNYFPVPNSLETSGFQVKGPSFAQKMKFVFAVPQTGAFKNSLISLTSVWLSNAEFATNIGNGHTVIVLLGKTGLVAGSFEYLENGQLPKSCNMVDSWGCDISPSYDWRKVATLYMASDSHVTINATLMKVPGPYGSVYYFTQCTKPPSGVLKCADVETLLKKIADITKDKSSGSCKQFSLPCDRSALEVLHNSSAPALEAATACFNKGVTMNAVNCSEKLLGKYRHCQNCLNAGGAENCDCTTGPHGNGPHGNGPHGNGPHGPSTTTSHGLSSKTKSIIAISVGAGLILLAIIAWFILLR